MTTKQDIKLATKWPSLDDWITELESGNWTQATSHLLLIDNDTGAASYCCLGVGCVVAFGYVPEHADEELHFWEEDFDHFFDAQDSTWYPAPDEDQIYVPADHYLHTQVTRLYPHTNAPEGNVFMALLIAANDGYPDGKYTAVIQMLKEFRDGVRAWRDTGHGLVPADA